jgi:TRAP-type transport system periplasmic protein
MKKGSFVAVLIIACLLIWSVGNVHAAAPKDKVIEFSFSDFFPPTYGMAKSAADWAKEVEKRSNSRVKITMYHGGTLTSATNCYEGVVKGLSEIGQSVFAYTRGRFPLMEVIDIPGYPFNAIITSRITQDIYDKFKPKELDDVQVLYLHAHIPGVFFMAKKPVYKLEDMKGMRIRATGLSTKIVDALGATSVAMPKGEQYDAMQKGVVDGTVGSPNELKGWRVAEVSKYSTWVPKCGYVSGMFVVMNKKKWGSLPKDIQQVFTDVSKEWVEYTGKAWNAIEVEGMEYGKQMGHTFIMPPPEEQARWDKAMQPIFDDYIKTMQSKALPGKEVVDYRNQLLEKYSKMYPPLKFQ